MNNPFLNSPEMQSRMQEVMRDPEVMAIMQRPEVMSKLQEAFSNPQRMMELMNDPDVQLLMRKMQQMPNTNMNNSFGNMNNNMNNNNMTSKIIHINSKEQFESILSNSTLTIAKFTASWCGPCKRIQPTFQNLANTHSKENLITFIEIDGDQQSTLVQLQQVRGYPTFHFYRNGISVDSFSGANEMRLRDTVERMVEDVEKPTQKLIYRHFPLKDSETVTYNSCKYDTVMEQLIKFNSQILNDSKQLSDDEIEIIRNSIIAKLKDKKNFHQNEFTADEYHIFEKLLLFPTIQAAPGLHLARMILRHPQMASHYVMNDEEKKDFDLLTHVSQYAVNAIEVKPVNTILALRVLINGFSRRVFTKYLLDKIEDIFDVLSTIISKEPEPKILTSITVLLINFAIVFKEDSETYAAGKIHMLSIILDMLNGSQLNCKIVYRLLVILGTLIVNDNDCMEVAIGMEIENVVKVVTHKYGVLSNEPDHEHVIECNEDILKIIGSD